MTNYTKWRSLVDEFNYTDAIPDSVVDRPSDDNANTDKSVRFGVRIETSVEWPEIGAEISTNTVGVTRAEIYRVSDGTLMGSTTFASSSGGDTFTINLDNNLVSGETYNFVVDNQGSNYDRGFNGVSNNSNSFPFTSSDGNLEIVSGAMNQTGDDVSANCLLKVGNVGFS